LWDKQLLPISAPQTGGHHFVATLNGSDAIKRSGRPKKLVQQAISDI
jgi:hypothetical protein